LILDVDTGTDDAVALMIAALSPDLELVGVSTVNGNTTVDYTTENTLRVFDWIGMPGIPVYRGLDRPIAGSQVERGRPRRSTGICSTCHPPRTAPRSSRGMPSTG
jgi:inosine-uridine nucleoside N-ribohydrolase